MITALIKDKVAVSPKHFPEMSPGGIIIPEQARPRINQGLVKYIGPDCKYVKVGDYVTFSAYTGTLFDLEGEGLIIILDEDTVTAVIDVNKTTPVPGLYFKDDNGDYFEADYEIAMSMIADAIENIGVKEKELRKFQKQRDRETVRVR